MNRRALHRAFMTICLFSLTKGCLPFASSHLGLVNDLRFWTANDLLESRPGSEPKVYEGLPRGAAIQNVIH